MTVRVFVVVFATSQSINSSISSNGRCSCDRIFTWRRQPLHWNKVHVTWAESRQDCELIMTIMQAMTIFAILLTMFLCRVTFKRTALVMFESAKLALWRRVTAAFDVVSNDALFLWREVQVDWLAWSVGLVVALCTDWSDMLRARTTPRSRVSRDTV